MKLILIDLSSIAHPIWHTSGKDPDVDATSRRTIEKVHGLASNQPHVAVCYDTGVSFRKDIDPEYKANRPTADAALHHQISLAVDALRIAGFPLWGAKGFEADDVIAAAAAAALKRTFNEFEAIVICSSDKDLLQLVGPRVEVHSLTSGVEYSESKVLEKFGVSPNQFVDYLSLVGDTADNIKGAKGIGAKKAAELLGKYGNLEDLFTALTTKGTEFTPGLATSLREFEPRMKQVRELVRLRTNVPIAFDEVLRERQAEDAVFAGEEGEPEPPPAAPVSEQMGATAVPAATPEPARVSPPMAAPEPAPEVNAPVVAPPAAAKAQPEHKPSPAVAGQVIDAPRPRLEAGPVPAPAALALRDDSSPAPMEWERQLEPRSYAQVKQLALDLYASRLYMAYGNAPAVMSVIMAGREMGMSAAASLRGFHIIDGKPTLAADLIRALVLRSGLCESFRCTERTATRCTFSTKRKGDDAPTEMSVTIEEGRQAFQGDDAKWAKSGWGRNPADMLVARCGAKLARLVYPDVVHGLYAREEFEGNING
jgi:5'-3' exonuclease